MTTNSRYTPPPARPVTAWARHIDAVRRERNLSQTAAYKLLKEAVELPGDSRSAFRPYLVDKEPDAEQAKALAAIIGWPPAEDAAPDLAPEPPPDLVTALLALAKSNDAMVAEAAAWRKERTDLVEQVAELRATVTLLLERTPVGQGTGAPTAPVSPGH